MKLYHACKLSILGALSLFFATSCTTQPTARSDKNKEVFTAPTPEMVDVSHGPGIPFGGIGTGFSMFGKYGFVDVYFDGRPLRSSDWRLDRPPQDPPSFAFLLPEGNQSIALQETSVAWQPNAQPVDKVR